MGLCVFGQIDRKVAVRLSVEQRYAAPLRLQHLCLAQGLHRFLNTRLPGLHPMLILPWKILIPSGT